MLAPEVQGGYDWLLAQIHSVRVDDCSRLQTMARDLARCLLNRDDGAWAADLMRQMISLVDEHLYVPTALGLRASSLANKVSAWLHALSLEHKKVQDVVSMLQSLVSVTSDMGVELGLTQFALQRIELVLPSWMASYGVIDNGSDDVDPPPPLRLEGSLLAGALPVPGMMHITTNVLSDMHVALSGWGQFTAGIQPLMLLLCYKARRERFIHRCVRASQYSHLEPLFGKNLIQYHDKRWFSIVSFLRQLEPLLAPLALTWSEGKYLAGHSGADGEDKIGKFSVAAVTASIQDGWLHSYVAMILMLDAMPEKLARWSEGCDCHQELRCAEPALKRSRLQAEDGSSCPMMGRRAPALASGKHLEFMDELLGLAPAELWRASGGANQDQTRWMHLLGDFHRGTGHLRSSLQQKLQFWSLLPWRLCALAGDEDDARAQGAVCVRLFEATSAAPLNTHHKVTLKFMTGEIRQELDRWLTGAPMQDCARLQREVAKLRLIPVCERIIEARGSQVSHALGSSKGPVRASLSLRLPELKQKLHSAGHGINNFVLAWERARHIKQAAEELHLSAHPELSALLAEADALHTTAVYPVLGKVLYHCDLTSQYGAHLQEAVQEHNYFSKLRAEQAKAVLQIFNATPPAVQLSENTIFEVSFLAHARKQLLGSCGVGDIFSTQITDADTLESLPKALLCDAVAGGDVQPVALGPVFAENLGGVPSALQDACLGFVGKLCRDTGSVICLHLLSPRCPTLALLPVCPQAASANPPFKAWCSEQTSSIRP